MSLIDNERTKLTAQAVDRLSTACAAAGFIAPVVSLLNNAGSGSISWAVIVSTATWLLMAVLLHLGGRRILGWLKP